MEKNARYTFRVNDEVRDKFMAYCKIMNISPSDILTEVMLNFNNDADKIIQMKNVDELQAMLQGKFIQVENEISQLKANEN